MAKKHKKGRQLRNHTSKQTKKNIKKGDQVIIIMKTAAAKGFGYQLPVSNFESDALFPKWLCTVSDVPGGLITKGCLK